MALIGASRNKQGLRLIQITDPHLGTEPGYRLAGIRTLESLAAIVAKVAESDLAPQGVIASGDIAGHGEAKSYQAFDDQMAALPCPYHWLPGNHDEPSVMERTLSVPFQLELRFGNWLLLMLNSKQVNKVGGRISEEELLAACTAALKHEGPVAVFVHHPPISVNSEWIDAQQIENGEDMLKRLADCGNVRAIFTGHVHQEFVGKSHGIDIYTAPSTCFQFAANSKEFAIGAGGPGYRWIDLYEDGRIDTGVVMLETANQGLDRHCIGY
ncbi:phosphodiesterase [Porticoccaceae bacterium LTM1]|nr:phosphodiesterase [Porticoccaceae bacterium LTM1]